MSRLDRQTISASFMSAIRSLDVNTVEELLRSDLEIEHQNRNHHSVLYTAVELIASGGKKVAQFKESNKHLNDFRWIAALQRIVQVLIESGRFNVDALTVESETVLNFATGKCMCEFYHHGDDYKDVVNSIIKLLLEKNANINARNSEGQTPLMRASYHGCSHIVQLLLDWRDEHGAGVDLNARDIYGETALILAAKLARVDVVELLLKHGCWYKIQNNRGFYALHAVIYGQSNLISDASSDFLAMIGALTSEGVQAALDQYAAHSMTGRVLRSQCKDNNLIQKTVSVLMTRGRADINAKDFRGSTVLDVALETRLQISQNTIEKLKEYGATSSVLLNEHPDYSKIAFQYTDKLGKTPLHRLSAVLRELTLGKKVDIMRHLISSHHKEAAEEMAIAKDHRGRTALHYAVIPTDIFLYASHLKTTPISKSEDIIQLIDFLKLRLTINEKDNYGRTPLHYCESEDIYKTLVEQGANEDIQDIDRKIPRDLKQLRDEEQNSRNLRHNLDDQLNQEKVDAWKIWKDSEFSYRDPFSMKLFDKVRQFMKRLSDEIRKKDPRFECRPVLIGSAEEGTKVGLPDEFDFNLILTKLSELCEVVPSPEAPSGFVHLKRRSYNNEHQNKNSENEKNFDKLFNSDGYLLTAEIASTFRILYLQVLSEAEFWKGEDIFEWDPNNEVGMIYVKEKRLYKEVHSSEDGSASYYPCNTIQLKMNRPLEGRYMFTLISLDIVSCVKIDGWWPEEALPSSTDNLKDGGCHLMFEQPQRHYPWVPFSDPFVKISFAPAEVRYMKERCPAVARAAYMVGKQLLLHYGQPKLTYVLKTCLLYCIEALKDCTNSSLLYKEIDQIELKYFVEKLMLCFHEFYLQDFLPCYMMPSFHLPIEYEFKYKHNQLLNNSGYEYPLFAYNLYKRVSTTEFPFDFCPPIPDPLNEKFNRKELLRKLSIDSSYIVHRHAQPEFRLAFPESLSE